MSNIIIKNLSKKIKNETILDNINIELNSGKTYGFVGYNGSGKSMLFKAICGLIKPTDGYISIDNKIIGQDISFPESIGIFIDEPGFIPGYSAYKNLKILADIQGKIGNNEINDALLSVGLDPNNNKAVKKYSLGMKQKLGIAQAIMENPDILILDEPMNGLDNDGVMEMRKLFINLREEGTMIIIASHNKEDIEVLCDEVFEMEKGKLTPVQH